MVGAFILAIVFGIVNVLQLLYEFVRLVIRLLRDFGGAVYRAFDDLRTNLAGLFPAWVTANHLTIARLYCGVLSTLTVLFFLADGTRWLLIANLGILAVALALDLLDGPRARIQGKTSTLGSLLDAGADKLITIVTVAFIATQLPGLRGWFTIFFLLELVHATAGLITNRKRALSEPLESNLPGKLKMVAVSLTMAFGLAAVVTGSTEGTGAAVARSALIASVPLALYSMLLHVARQRRTRLAVVEPASTKPASSA